MSILKNMKLATMLGAGFAIVLVISFFVSGYGQIQLRQQGNTINTLASDQLEGLLLVQELKDNLNSIAIVVRELTLFTAPDQVEQYKQQISKTIARNSEVIKRIGELAVSPKEKALFDGINQVRPN
ncbi:MCP four helix bundle domain-containing protein [Dickeya undicola]|uniref:MCP four helix bundle domain-containing protein n=1 Tax=Dickeya undicola TaxID=1577887 RepID=UPI003F275813